MSAHVVNGPPTHQRVEINSQRIPRDVVEIAERAFYRRIEDVRRAYPGAHGLYGFTYVEYGAGQYFTPHIDGGINTQVAGFGVTLSDDFDGGEFIVQTCGSSSPRSAAPSQSMSDA